MEHRDPVAQMGHRRDVDVGPIGTGAVLQDGSRLGDGDSALTVNQCRNPTIWVDRKKALTVLFTLVEIHQCPVVGNTQFLKQDGELPAVLGGVDQAANFTVR